MKRIYALCIVLMLVACKKVGEPVAFAGQLSMQWANPIDSVRAGASVRLSFTGIDSDTGASVYISNAYGTTVLPLKKEQGRVQCIIPQNFTRKAGPLHWKIMQNKEVMLANSFTILPDNRISPHVETYFGPRSITVGEHDFSMLVAIPTDSFDNSLLAGTPVTIKSEFENKVESTEARTADFIAWKNIYAKKTVGRILVSASCLGTDTKELTTILFPANAETFEITYQRNHSYADGNQIISFQTDILKDRYGNVVSDGTLVTFLIANSNRGHLKTTGLSIGGIAKASLLHPAEKEQWEVTAFVTGAAKSNTISVAFEQAISDFEVSFSEGRRTVTVGPVKSFMNQIVPDGIAVILSIYDSDGKHLDTKKKTTKKGMCLFKLPSEYFKNGSHRLDVRAAGMLKTHRIELE